jgi:hypothetical protein
MAVEEIFLAVIVVLIVAAVVFAVALLNRGRR